MVKQGVVPDDLTRPFFEAANEGRLVVQSCTNSDRLYFPPRPASEICGEGESVVWKEVSGRGTIYNYCVVYDCPVASLKEDLPFNLAVIMLEEDPRHPDVLSPAGRPTGRGSRWRRRPRHLRGDRQRPEGSRVGAGRIGARAADPPANIITIPTLPPSFRRKPESMTARVAT